MHCTLFVDMIINGVRSKRFFTRKTMEVICCKCNDDECALKSIRIRLPMADDCYHEYQRLYWYQLLQNRKVLYDYVLRLWIFHKIQLSSLGAQYYNQLNFYLIQQNCCICFWLLMNKQSLVKKKIYFLNNVSCTHTYSIFGV